MPQRGRRDLALLVLYVLYLVFMLRPHSGVVRAHADGRALSRTRTPNWSTFARGELRSCGASLVRGVDERRCLVGAAEATGKALGGRQSLLGIVASSPWWAASRSSVRPS